jgi:hypothetical protein
MTAKQLDIFEFLKTISASKVPETRLLEMLEAVDGISHPKFRVSDALKGFADLLAGELERKDRGFNRFVHQVGQAVKPQLIVIDHRTGWRP